MPRVSPNTSKRTKKSKKSSAFKTPEGRENYLIDLAFDLTERMLRDGTATSQMITHFLRLATVKEQLENEKLRSDLKLAEAKIQQIQAQEDIKELYSQALEAMKSYSGEKYPEEEYDEEY